MNYFDAEKTWSRMRNYYGEQTPPEAVIELEEAGALTRPLKNH